MNEGEGRRITKTDENTDFSLFRFRLIFFLFARLYCVMFTFLKLCKYLVSQTDEWIDR